MAKNLIAESGVQINNTVDGALEGSRAERDSSDHSRARLY